MHTNRRICLKMCTLTDSRSGIVSGIFTRMRQQLDQLLRSFGGGSAPGFPSVQSGFPQIPGLDLGKGNTTSVTKVIDGHKVVINETEYNKQGDFGGAFFKVRIIDVKPDSSESTTATASSEGDDSTREVAENSAENEVTKNEVGKSGAPEKLTAI